MRNESPPPLEQEQGVLSLPAGGKKLLNLKSPFSPFPPRFHEELLWPVMEFFILLALSFCCCRATPLPTREIDCDDPAVFNAVDLALQKFNGGRTYGHQFALVVVTKATRTAGPGTSFFLDVKYQIRETVCSVGDGIPWQNCKFRDSLEAESGECEARIYVGDLLNFSDVSQECRLTAAAGMVTASRAPCTGCWAPISTNSLELLPLVRHTIRRFNNQTSHPSLFEVLEITKAQSQVVAGWNYAYEYSVKETNCSKAEFPDLTPACKRIPGGREGKCFAVAHINITNGLSYAVQECRLQVEEDVSRRRSCPGCPRPLETNSTQLEKPLRAALEKYNVESNSDAYYKVEDILEATAQVVAGTKYHVEFIVVKTNCSKADFRELSEDCSPEEKGERQRCTASIYVIPWESKIFPNVTCERYKLRAAAFAAWPPGMTPFRSLAALPPTTASKGIVGNQRSRLSSSRRGLGAALPPALGHKQGQEQTKKTSSKDSHEVVGKQEEISLGPVGRILKVQPSFAKPCLQEGEASEEGAECPAPPSQQDNTDDSSDFSASDLLPGSDAPKCPGKPWKPITADTVDAEVDAEDDQAASPSDFQDFDLADAFPAD